MKFRIHNQISRAKVGLNAYFRLLILFRWQIMLRCRYRGIILRQQLPYVTWHPFRQNNFRTNYFQTVFLIWIFIGITFPFQWYQIWAYLDNLFIFHHYDVIPEMKSFPANLKKGPERNSNLPDLQTDFTKFQKNHTFCQIVLNISLPMLAPH